jgi:predicted CoA-binding protein
MKELTTDAEIRDVLARAKTIAVLGAHRDASRPAHYVPRYLQAHGYRVLPVNAVQAGQQLLGETVRAKLDELAEPVDIVDIFRRADALEAHLPDILAMDPRPGAVWMQLGIRNDSVAARLTAEGIRVVQDRCAKVEHERLIG